MNITKSILLIVAFIFCKGLQAQIQKGQHRWWPHPEWGAEDQAGSSNRINAETVMRALNEIKRGKIVELSFVHEAEMPVSPGRTFKMLTPSFPTGGPGGQHDIVWNDDYFSGELGHVGTQFDALAHIGKRVMLPDGRVEDRYYNGFTGPQLKSPYGVKKLGVENVKPIITRCFLIDIAGYKSMPTLPSGYTVTLEEVLGALKEQKIDPDDVNPGDAVFFNYGWWRYWPDPKKVFASRPGINAEVARWLIDKKISLVGSDNSTDQGGTHAVHYLMMVEQGIHNLEFMNFESILAEGVDRFALFFTPLRLKGATGSPARPVAVF